MWLSNVPHPTFEVQFATQVTVTSLRFVQLPEEYQQVRNITLELGGSTHSINMSRKSTAGGLCCAVFAGTMSLTHTYHWLSQRVCKSTV